MMGIGGDVYGLSKKYFERDLNPKKLKGGEER